MTLLNSSRVINRSVSPWGVDTLIVAEDVSDRISLASRMLDSSACTVVMGAERT